MSLLPPSSLFLILIQFAFSLDSLIALVVVVYTHYTIEDRMSAIIY